MRQEGTVSNSKGVQTKGTISEASESLLKTKALTCTRMLVASLFITAKKLRTTQMSIDRWMDKLWFMHLKYYIDKNERIIAT